MKIRFTILILSIIHRVSAQQVYVTVSAEGYVRNKTIVSAALSKSFPANNSYQVINIHSGKASPVQQTDATHILFILPDVLQPGDVATYQVVKKAKQQVANPVTVEKQDKGLLVKVQGKKALFYNTSLILPPDTLPAFYARSGFIHPLYSPAGKILTDDFPAGHAHQHGIMMAWTSTTFKGGHPDFWNQHLQTGNVQHVKVESIISGPVAAILQLRLQHYTNLHGEVLSERWTVTIYPFNNYFLFDIHTTQQNTTSDTLFLNKYMYGGAAFRGSRQWNDADSLRYTSKWNIGTDSGFNLVNADGRRAAYVSASGFIDGTVSGVTVFGFPDIYNYPQPIRVHPVMPYWCFAPAATEPFTINPGQTYTARYRYCSADGQPDEKLLQAIHNDLLHPARVIVFYKKANAGKQANR